MIDTVSLYWDVVTFNDGSRDHKGGYLAVNEETNTLLDTGVFNSSKNKLQDHQRCVRTALDNILSTYDIGHLVVENQTNVKPELEIGRLPYHLRDKAQEMDISVQSRKSINPVLKGITSHTETIVVHPPNHLEDVVDVYVDGSYSSHRDEATVGIAMYSPNQRNLELIFSKKVDVDTSHKAELQAVKKALYLAKEMGVKANLHSDYDIVRDIVVDGRSVSDADLQDTNDIKSFYTAYAKSWSVISSEENRLAHNLANQAYWSDVLYTSTNLDDIDMSSSQRYTKPLAQHPV